MLTYIHTYTHICFNIKFVNFTETLNLRAPYDAQNKSNYYHKSHKKF